MIKTELEWHSNKESPTPEYHCYYFMICDTFGEFYQVDAVFEDDVFLHFTERDEQFFELVDITCWTMLPSSTTLMEFFTDDKVTDCVCGDTTPHKPWWEDCGLGNSEEHCREASEQLVYDNVFDAITNNKEEAAEMKRQSDEKIKERAKREEDNSFIVANMAQCVLCKDVVESHSRHDFVSCSCKDGIAVDGGLSYLRRVGERENIIELSVYSTDDYDTIRTHFKRGSRGVFGDQPLTWIPLKNMTTSHLWSVLDYDRINNTNSPYTKLYQKELEYRGEWK